MQSYYEILGIPSSASEDEIKKAYRKLSKTLHPDKNDSDTFFNNYFQKINEAYSILGDIEKRKQYDNSINKRYSNDTTTPVDQTKKDVKKEESYKPSNHTSTKNNSIYPTIWDKVRKWRKIKNSLWVINIFLILYIIFVPKNYFSSIHSIKGKVNVSKGLNLRASFNSSAPIITSIPYNESVEILNQIGQVEKNANGNIKWIEVKYGKYKGWVCDIYIDK